jgi:hypothetical protein
VELLLLCPILVGLGHGGGGVGLRRCLHLDWGQVRPVLLAPSVQPINRVAVTGRHPDAQPNWGYEVDKKDIHKLWLVLDVLKSLL